MYGDVHRIAIIEHVPAGDPGRDLADAHFGDLGRTGEQDQELALRPTAHAVAVAELLGEAPGGLAQHLVPDRRRDRRGISSEFKAEHQAREVLAGFALFYDVRSISRRFISPVTVSVVAASAIRLVARFSSSRMRAMRDRVS